MTQDILFGLDGDLLIRDGDLVVGDSKYQHIEDLLLAKKGFFKFDPLVGIDVESFINDEFQASELLRQIRVGLEADGLRIDTLYIQEDGKLKVDGEYRS